MTAQNHMAPIYQFDFATDPKAAGWTYQPSTKSDDDLVYIPSEGYYRNKGGVWQSPGIKCVANPFQFYRVTFESIAGPYEYYAIRSYDTGGIELVDDAYGLLQVSKGWAKNTVYFRGRERGATLTVSFVSKTPVSVRNLAVVPVAREEVCRAADASYATLPPLTYRPEPNRWATLGWTIQRLQTGGPIRIVMLGDSIVNDTNNSNWDALLMRLYPKADVRLIASVLGSTCCWYYREDAHFKSYVADLKPDLLVIGGLSHKQDLEAIRAVVRKARTHCHCEILLTSAPMGKDWREPDAHALDKPLAQTTYKGDAFNNQMRALAQEGQIAFLDLNTIWNDYLAASGMPYQWFQRDDGGHACDRGQQILARILERFFAPRGRGSRSPRRAAL